jgi:hypothetical protein
VENREVQFFLWSGGNFLPDAQWLKAGLNQADVLKAVPQKVIWKIYWFSSARIEITGRY